MLTLLALTALPARALGQTPAQTQTQTSAQVPTPARDTTILLTVAAPPTEAAKLEAVAEELLKRLEMQVELRRVERIDLREIRQPLRREPAYFARVWIAFGRPGRARLYLEHAARDRVLVRDVTDDSNNPELVREELGHILQTAVEGLKAGEEIGAPRGEALLGDEQPAAPPAKPTAAPAPATRALAPPRRRFRFGPRYELVWLGDAGHFEDGPGAVFGAMWAQRWGIELGGSFRRPAKVEAPPVGARLQSVAFDALLVFEIWHHAPARFRLAAGAEADFVRVSPFASAGQNATLAPSHWLKLALGRFAATYAHRVGTFMDLELTLGAELDPSGTRYVFQRTNSATTDVLSPWPVRPLLSLGATVP